MKSAKIEITCLVCSPFDENTYILFAEGQTDCVVVDPGLEPDKIIAFLDRKKLTPTAILITHGHCDHIAGTGAIKNRWPKCPILVGKTDAAMLTSPELNLSAPFGMPIKSPPADQTLVDGQVFQVAGISMKALEIPGHTPGHMTYLIHEHTPPWVIVGDVIFAGSIGRTDFPGGSLTDLTTGIRQKLFTLPEETVLWPGHGPATTVGEEKASNPYVGGDAS